MRATGRGGGRAGPGLLRSCALLSLAAVLAAAAREHCTRSAWFVRSSGAQLGSLPRWSGGCCESSQRPVVAATPCGWPSRRAYRPAASRHPPGPPRRRRRRSPPWSWSCSRSTRAALAEGGDAINHAPHTGLYNYILSRITTKEICIWWCTKWLHRPRLGDPYAVLGLEYSAAPAEARAAFRRLSRTSHPDRLPAGTDAPAPESEALPVGGARLGTHPGCIPRTRPASVQ